MCDETTQAANLESEFERLASEIIDACKLDTYVRGTLVAALRDASVLGAAAASGAFAVTRQKLIDSVNGLGESEAISESGVSALLGILDHEPAAKPKLCYDSVLDIPWFMEVAAKSEALLATYPESAQSAWYKEHVAAAAAVNA